jgi:hypothetical protein
MFWLTLAIFVKILLSSTFSLEFRHEIHSIVIVNYIFPLVLSLSFKLIVVISIHTVFFIVWKI